MSQLPEELTDSGDAYISSLFAWMREKIGIDPGEMLKGDDWLLIIKLHAMIESALNVALVLELRDSRLETVIGRLDTSDGSRGKVAFAKALEILEKPSVDFLQALSSLRNLCVHNIRNFKFDLLRHLAEHPNANEHRVALRKGMERLTFPDKKVPERFISDDPRMALFLGTWSIMLQLHLHNEKCEVREAELKLCQAKAERLDKIEPPQSTPTG